MTQTKRVYAVDVGGDRVLDLDGDTLDELASIPVGRTPDAIAIDQKAGRLYVADHGKSGTPGEIAGGVTVIDTRTDRVVATVPTKGHPVSIDAYGDRTYVGALRLANGDSDFIQVIDTHSNTEVATVGTSAPSMLLADPVDQVVYGLSPFVRPSSSQQKTTGSKWIELDMRTLAAGTYVDGPGDARAIAWHAGSDLTYRHVYVATQRDIGGALTIYDPPGARWTRLSRRSDELRVGDHPVAIGVDPVAHRVYVASNGDNVIDVILQAP